MAKTATKNENGVARKPANRLPSTGLKRVRVTIKGIAPGVIFQGKGLMEQDGSDNKKKKARTADDEAKLRAHWMREGGKEVLCIPWVMLYQSICAAAKQFKYRARQTMAQVVAATIACEVDRISLGTTEFETYEEYCRIPPRTGAMVKIGRPRLREWQASFTMVVDDELYDANGLRDIIQHAGKLIGIGAWRAELKGPYGRYEVVDFEIDG